MGKLNFLEKHALSEKRSFPETRAFPETFGIPDKNESRLFTNSSSLLFQTNCLQFPYEIDHPCFS